MTTGVLRPYADLDGIFEQVEYRANLIEGFEPLDIDGDSTVKTVRADDLRTIPQHQFRVKLHLDALKPLYERHKESLRLVILVRDTTLRQELILGDFPIDEVPETIHLDRNRLRLTGLRDELPVQFVVLSRDLLRGNSMYPAQRASRLAELQVLLRNNAGGASFPYKRASAEEMRREGLPQETGVHLKLFCDAVELIKESDTPIRNLFEVWIHETIWSAIQNDHSPSSAALRTSAVTIATATALFASVAPLLKDQQEIHPESPIGQLLSHLEKMGSRREGDLRKAFEKNPSIGVIAPYVQNAFRFVTNASRIEEELPE